MRYRSYQKARKKRYSDPHTGSLAGKSWVIYLGETRYYSFYSNATTLSMAKLYLRKEDADSQARLLLEQGAPIAVVMPRIHWKA
jgi:hypothetical protein